MKRKTLAPAPGSGVEERPHFDLSSHLDQLNQIQSYKDRSKGQKRSKGSGGGAGGGGGGGGGMMQLGRERQGTWEEEEGG